MSDVVVCQFVKKKKILNQTEEEEETFLQIFDSNKRINKERIIKNELFYSINESIDG